jgi:DNA-directed RNA polymerase specialized sigma24 family protein
MLNTNLKHGRGTSRAKVDYVDNAELYDEFCTYKKTKVITDKMAEAFIKIAARIKDCASFAGYDYEDMVDEAIFNCISNAHKFDIKQTKNPFGYFTSVVYFTYLQRIKKEAKRQGLKAHTSAVTEYMERFGFTTINESQRLGA